MGLTGVVAEVTLELWPIETALLLVDTERAPGLEACMGRLEALAAEHRYSVAWVDGQARGRRLGRAVISSGEHARLGDLPASRREGALAYAPGRRHRVPGTPPFGLVGRPALAAGNEVWFRKAPARRTGELQSIGAFFHPLDALDGWNRLYGPRGFTQYQFVVPPGAAGTVRAAIELLHDAGVAPRLAVLKTLGPADPSPLSFPIEGWTLALDLPLGRPGLARALDRLDELVASSGGRVYLAKDGRLRPELLSTMYPRLGEWLAVRDRADPTRSLQVRSLAPARPGWLSAAAASPAGGGGRAVVHVHVRIHS